MNYHYSITIDGHQIEHSCTDRISHVTDGSLQINAIETAYDGLDAKSLRLEIQNLGATAANLSHIYFGIRLEDKIDTVEYFKSGWGTELSPLSSSVGDGVKFGNVSGRSNLGYAPYLRFAGENAAWALSFAWTGNFEAEVRPTTDGTLVLFQLETGHFSHELKGGCTFRTPEIHLCQTKLNVYATTAMERSAQSLRLLTASLIPANDRLQKAMVAYNTWWPFEDIHINEDTYLANAALAAQLGATSAVQDAGWFGPSTAGSDWQQKRGDWHQINRHRFPHGFQDLVKKSKQLGIKSGIWCEIETIDAGSIAAETMAAYLARRDGEFLNYLCLANEEAFKWAKDQLTALIEDGFTWVKLDFNIDPKLGCNQTDHAHGEGDGLFQHIRSLYRLIDEIHREFPDVILENCSSGGLRLDAGMAQHCDLHFLSDPDFTEHHLQVLWGALSYLPANVLYHFTWSETLGEHNIIRSPITDTTSEAKIRFILRTCMIGIPGLSYDLRKFSSETRLYIAEGIDYYKSIYEAFIRDGRVWRLTEQSLTHGRGERFPGFQLSSRDGRQLLFSFRLTGAPAHQTYKLFELADDTEYEIQNIDTRELVSYSGAELNAAGFRVADIAEEEAAVYLFRPISPSN